MDIGFHLHYILWIARYFFTSTMLKKYNITLQTMCDSAIFCRRMWVCKGPFTRAIFAAIYGAISGAISVALGLRIQIARVKSRQLCCDSQFRNRIASQPFRVCSKFTAISIEKNKIIPSHSDMYRIMIFAPFAGKNKFHWETKAINKKELAKDRNSIVRYPLTKTTSFPCCIKIAGFAASNRLARRSEIVSCSHERFEIAARGRQWNRTVNCTKNRPCERALRIKTVHCVPY